MAEETFEPARQPRPATLADQASGHSPSGGPDLHPGRQVDGYEVVRELGEGGMGAVFLVRDIKLGRKAVLKVIHPDQWQSAELVERFLFEAQVTANFNHPHIVTIYGVGEIEGFPYVAMEYLRGHPLRERMQGEPFPLDEVLRISLAIADALAEAHKNGVLHRDLKPENVFLTRDGRLRVLDFGLAKMVRASARPTNDSSDSWPLLEDSGDPESDPLVRTAGAPATQSSSATPRPVARVQPREPQISLSTRGLVGTPSYMAPEQWKKQPLTHAVDIWALGLMMWEMLTGDLPYPTEGWSQLAIRVTSATPVPRVDTKAPGIPRFVADLIARMLQKEPLLRPTAENLVEELTSLAGGGRRRTVSVSDLGQQGPFRGLLPFRPEDADRFFGRNAEIVTLLEKLRSQALLPVVGPPGVGKTSLVMAGLIPALEQRGGWRIFVTRPGDRPFQNLADSLLHAKREPFPLAGGGATERGAGLSPAVFSFVGGPSLDLAGDLAATPAFLGALLRAEANSGTVPGQPEARSRDRRGVGSRVLLVVDQLEELYTLSPESKVRSAFEDALALAADDVDGPVRVVVTLRDDYLTRLAGNPALAVAIDAGLLLLRPPSPEALADTLIRPVEALGYAYEDDQLVCQMVGEVEREPAALALLQFAAQRLWEAQDRNRRLLLRSAYKQMGGVAGALTDHADRFVDELSPARRQLVRILLLRLTTAEGTRRLMTRRQLLLGLAGTATPHEAMTVLDRLVDARLVVMRGAWAGDQKRNAPEPGDRGEIWVELAHDSLLTRWQRLKHWRAEEREDLSFRERLGVAAVQWIKSGRAPGLLWGGAELDGALAWWARYRGPLAPAEEEFLAGLKAKQRRKRNLSWLSFLGLLVLTLLIAGGAMLAVSRIRLAQQAALHQAQEAQAAEARARLHLSAALYGEGLDAATEGDRLTAEALFANSLAQAEHAGARGALYQLRARADRPVLRWQTETRERVAALAIAPDEQEVATAEGPLVRIRSASSRQPPVQLAPTEQAGPGLHQESQPPLGELEGHVEAVTAIAYARDGRIATASADQTVRLWDPISNQTRQLLEGQRGRVNALAFSGDGLRLASAGADRIVHLWEPSTGRLLQVLKGHSEAVRSLAFQAGSPYLASGGDDRRLLIWNTETGDLVQEITEFAGRLFALAFAPDGRTLFVGEGPDLRSWDVTGLPLEPPRERERQSGHRRWICGLAVTPDNTRIATGSWDRTVRVWELQSGQEVARLVGFEKPVCALGWLEQGRALAVAGGDSRLRVWRLGLPAEAAGPRTMEGAAAIMTTAFSPDGRSLASAGLGPTIRFWNVATGRALAQVAVGQPESGGEPGLPGEAEPALSLIVDREEVKLGAEQDWISAIAYSPDGRLLAAVGGRGARCWELEPLAERVDLRIGGRAFYSLAWFPDGGAILLGGQAELLLADLGEQRELIRLASLHGWVRALAVAPDGKLVAAAGDDDTIRLFRREDGQELPALLRQGSGATSALCFTPDGRSLIAGSEDQTVLVWDLETRRSRAWTAGHPSGIDALALSPDGLRLATGGADQTIRLWDLPTGRELAVLQAHHGPVREVTFSPDGLRLASGGWDRAVRLWDLPQLLEPADRLLRQVEEETGLVLDGLKVRLKN